MSSQRVTADEIADWYSAASGHLYRGVFATTLWATRYPEIADAWERWIEEERPDLLEGDDPRIDVVESTLVEEESFDAIVDFLDSLPDDARDDAITTTAAAVEAMRCGTFRPCVGPFEIEELYDFKGGPLFEEAWADVAGLDEAFVEWNRANHTDVFEQWAQAWPPSRAAAYPNDAICALESANRGTDHPYAMSDFHATLPFELAVASSDALAAFRARYGG